MDSIDFEFKVTSRGKRDTQIDPRKVVQYILTKWHDEGNAKISTRTNRILEF